MPHVNDLQVNNIIEGVNGERWIVEGAVNSPDEKLLTLKRLKVVEKIINEDEIIPE